MQSRTLNGRYRLDELIGEGGMAVVYRGYDQVLNRVVAIKLLRDQYASDTSFLRRFEREAQSAARLSHPHIANVYDVGQDGPTRYIVMEFVDGPSLKDLIRRQGPFSAEGAAFIIRQVAEALDYAHERGLVHRDIKPQNILVDESGNVKVVDFGIAKGLSDTNLTETGTGMGTVHYVSPEQARGQPATPASDIYSTGIVLYEILTRRLPFEADTPVGVAMQHVNAAPPPPSQFNPAIPPEVEDIILQALAKDPRDRFQTAGELADALERWERAARALPVGGASQATRAVVAAGPSAASRRRPAPPAAYGGRGGRSAAAREATFRDDIGCVTWLIGIAILIGLVGLVVLAFKMGDFSLFQPSTNPTATATIVAGAGSPTATTATTPSQPAASPTAKASPSPTVSPTPSASPTPQMAFVPSLVGSTLEQAKVAVSADDFELVEEEVFDEVTPRGQIIDQDPRAGAPAPKGSPVHVTVSKGPEFVALGEYQGQPRAKARQQLEALGLTVKEVEEGSATVPQGNVIRTDPAAQARNGDTVTLYVSVGDKIKVPDVFRQPVQQAVSALKDAGFAVGARSPQSCTYIKSQDASFDCESFPDGGVVSADLQWNSWVPRGSTINIAYFDAKAQ